jgi:hypothetical protein
MPKVVYIEDTRTQGHFHLHDNEGLCFGDYLSLDRALEEAAEIMAIWNTTWGTAPLVVIDAPVCIDVCREADRQRACEACKADCGFEGSCKDCPDPRHF